MTRHLALVLACGALVLATAPARAFTHWPNATCPDSVTLHQINAPGPCQPTAGNSTAGDTVMSVGGIIVALDQVPSTYGMYIQNNRADSTGYLCGMDVFSGSRNYAASPYNFALGDSVVVELGVVGKYQGSLQVFSPNNNSQTPDLIVRRVGPGSRTPDVFTATTTQLRTNETNTSAIPYLCSLVRINGPLVVARKNVTGTNNFYVVNPSAPGDSVYVNGYSLTSFGSPEVGTSIDYVQGVFEHKTSTHYSILLRGAADIGVSTPPNLVTAYAVDDGHVRAVFDRDVTPASATTTSNWSLASFGSVDGAAMDGTTAVVLAITNGLAHGAHESVTCNNIAGVANGLTMSVPQSATFVNGVLSVRELVAPNPDSLLATPCFDRSRYAGSGGHYNGGQAGMILSFRGVCDGVFGSVSDYMDAGRPVTGDHGGIAVYGTPVASTVGHEYLIVGLPQMYYNEPELYQITYQQDLGAVELAAPIPLTVRTASRDTCEASSAGGGAGYVPPSAVPSGKDFDGMLVQLSYVQRVVRRDLAAKPTTGFHVAGESPAFTDTMFVLNYDGVLGASDSLNVNYPPEGDILSITGVLHYDGSGYRVCPRGPADIVDHGANVGVPAAPARLAFAVQPNPARRATVAFTLPAATRVDLAVYDVAGRRVAQLWSGALPAGRYTREWAGRGDDGRTVGAGVYFYRLRVNGETRVVRGILLGN